MRANGGALELDVFQGGVPLPAQQTTAFVTVKVDPKTAMVMRVKKKP